MENLTTELNGRLTIGRTRYGHGVRVDDDTSTWGTQTNSWLEMAKEEFLDAIIYLTADYIRVNRDSETGKMGQMELQFMESRPGFVESDDSELWLKANPLVDDNDLIIYIIHNWRDIEPCRYKTILCTLINILDLDPSSLLVYPYGSEPYYDSSDSPSDTSLSSFGEFQWHV